MFSILPKGSLLVLVTSSDLNAVRKGVLEEEKSENFVLDGGQDRFSNAQTEFLPLL